MKRRMIIAALGVPLTVLTMSGCTRSDEAVIPDVARPIYAIEVDAEESTTIRKFTGRAKAADAVTLAFEVSGKILNIGVDIGDRVKEGDVLASLDPRDFENALRQAEAELLRAKSQFERMRRAEENRAVSEQDVTDAKAAYDSALANVAIHTKALADTKLLAPYDSIVTAKYVSDFGNVLAKQPAIRVVDPTRIEMVADIPEDMISHANEGMHIAVEFDALPGTIIRSTIHEIGKEASQTTRTYPVTLIMDQPEEVKVLPGMAGRAWRQDGIRDGIPNTQRGFDIPLSAIQSAHGGSFVWVVDSASETVKRVPVDLGDVTRRGVLVRGLRGNETIATAGVNSLQDGQKVRVVSPIN